jgi:excisionase family DNA binding protein
MASKEKTIVDTAGRADSLSIVADGLASVAEGMKFLSVSRSKLHELMNASEIQYAKVGRSRRIPWRALREYAARCMAS